MGFIPGSIVRNKMSKLLTYFLNKNVLFFFLFFWSIWQQAVPTCTSKAYIIEMFMCSIHNILSQLNWKKFMVEHLKTYYELLAWVEYALGSCPQPINRIFEIKQRKHMCKEEKETMAITRPWE